MVGCSKSKGGNPLQEETVERGQDSVFPPADEETTSSTPAESEEDIEVSEPGEDSEYAESSEGDSSSSDSSEPSEGSEGSGESHTEDSDEGEETDVEVVDEEGTEGSEGSSEGTSDDTADEDQETEVAQEGSAPAADCDEVYVKNSLNGVMNLSHEEEVTVECFPGYAGGGSFSCSDGSFINAEGESAGCVDEATDFSPEGPFYAEEDFHCDDNNDGVVDVGEMIDFPAHSFVFTVDTRLGSQTLELPIKKDSRKDLIYVDWGDGQCSILKNEKHPTHQYRSNRAYTVRITGREYRWGYQSSQQNYRNIINEVHELGNLFFKDLSGSFSFTPRLVAFNASYSNGLKVRDTSFMFHEASAIQDLYFDSFNTRRVKNMSYMFSKMSSLRRIDVSNFDTRNVTDMSHMFFETNRLVEVDLSSFNTRKVRNFNNMFYRAYQLRTLNLGYWEVDEMIDSSNIFHYFRGYRPHQSTTILCLNDEDGDGDTEITLDSYTFTCE